MVDVAHLEERTAAGERVATGSMGQGGTTFLLLPLLVNHGKNVCGNKY